ncbi:hypothetical protein AM1_1319 [Acaryochloris marina MBIC11017]|uniref:Uncharacterized protein n=1 Tax=Acaryochloris marina (strain MBIC 11017) TaxID=329726 RepID=B0C5B3_ACAM1|nr:hypothetical protein AM1_1319 [Acaryochloris marina MBIC11017]
MSINEIDNVASIIHDSRMTYIYSPFLRLIQIGKNLRLIGLV